MHERTYIPVHLFMWCSLIKRLYVDACMSQLSIPMSKYVYMCICIIYIYTHTHIHIHTCMHSCMYAHHTLMHHIHTYIHIYIHTDRHTHTYINTYMYIIYIPTYIPTCMHAYHTYKTYSTFKTQTIHTIHKILTIYTCNIFTQYIHNMHTVLSQEISLMRTAWWHEVHHTWKARLRYNIPMYAYVMSKFTDPGCENYDVSVLAHFIYICGYTYYVIHSKCMLIHFVSGSSRGQHARSPKHDNRYAVQL